MKIKTLIYPIVFSILISCNNEEKKERNGELTSRMVGDWRSVSMKLNMNSFRNSDSARVFEVTEENWESKMNIRPIRTIFRADGSYNTEHWNLADSLIYNPAGRWAVYGDSILMTDTFPSIGQAYRYKLVLKDSLVEFYGREDLDRDGLNDDDYFGIQRRQR